jgi:hypothetical protein
MSEIPPDLWWAQEEEAFINERDFFFWYNEDSQENKVSSMEGDTPYELITPHPGTAGAIPV